MANDKKSMAPKLEENFETLLAPSLRVDEHKEIRVKKVGLKHIRLYLLATYAIEDLTYSCAFCLL